MLQNKLNEIELLLEKYNYAVIYNEQNVDAAQIFFSDLVKNNMIKYNQDDSLFSNYTKIMSFFKVNALYKKDNSNLKVDDLDVSKESFIKLVLRLPKTIINAVKLRKYNKIKRKYEAFSFTSEELSLMTKISTFCNERTQTIIINNFNYASKNDLLFYKKIIESGFLNMLDGHMKIIFISNSANVSDANLNEIESECLIKLKFSEDELITFLKTTYSDICISDNTIKQYLKLCNNNFNLIYTIIKSKTTSYDSDIINVLKDTVRDILNKLGEINALEFAAVVGLSFDLTLLSEASNIALDEIIYQSTEAQEKGLLLKTDNEYNFEFIDELIRSLVYKYGHYNIRSHIQYANYLSKARPEEHALIANHFYLGGNMNYAIIHYFCYLLKNTIEGKDIDQNSSIHTRIISIINKDPVLNAVYIEFIELLNGYKNNSLIYDKLIYNPQEKCESIYDLVMKYVKSTLVYMCRFSQSKEDYYNLSQCFEHSYAFFESNKFLAPQIQCAFYLLDIYSYRISCNEKVSNILSKLNDLTSDISNSNDIQNYNLKIRLIRKTANLMNPEVAYNKTKYIYESLQTTDYNLDEVEIYKFLTNHLGFALYSGNYDDVSEDFLYNIEQYINIACKMNFPKSYKLEMNYLIYKLYNNKTDINEISKFLLKQSKKEIDARMYLFDIAALNLFCSNYDQAEKILLELIKKTESNMTCFYDYCINANLASLYLLKGNYDLAEKHNNIILEHDYEWEKEFIDIMRFRANELQKIIDNKLVYSSKQLFECFNGIPIYISSVWRFLGKGIIFSELMFYRE